MNHPEELLASFADGTASVDERALVEAHLLFCQTCRREIEESKRALAALERLPELTAPPLELSEVLEPVADQVGPLTTSLPEAPATRSTARGDGSPPPTDREPAVSPPMRQRSTGPEPSRPAPSSRPSRRPRSHWPVRAVQAGMAVAAVAVGVVIISHLGGGSNPATSGSERAGGAGSVPAAAPKFGAAAIPSDAQSLTAKSFTALAAELAGEARRQPAKSLTSGPGSATPSDSLSPSTTDLAIDCMQRATGVVSGAQLYYFQGAFYEGVPSYVGAFVSRGQHPGLLVVAVAVDGCRPLNIVREKL